MNNFTTRISAARRNAENMLNKSRKQDSSQKGDQERQQQALSEKTARLRELRLAKEAEDRSAAAAKPPAGKTSKKT
ncbi:MAG TPA: hypothetical protein VEX16_05885 [Methyloceanibacter sp.]|jgi:hypothetical protein|nr:hypothetical protein [Methyloceanibacter sp.]